MKKYKNNVNDAFEKAFTQIDAKISGGLNKSMECGSTGTIGLITLEQSKRVLYIGHVGDSSAYIFDDNFG